MKLDDTVCRGSIVRYQGTTRVLVTKCQQTVLRPESRISWTLVPGWKTCTLVDAEKGELIFDDVGIALTDEVDWFFPGVAYELPDYIK